MSLKDEIETFVYGYLMEKKEVPYNDEEIKKLTEAIEKEFGSRLKFQNIPEVNITKIKADVKGRELSVTGEITFNRKLLDGCAE